MAIFKLIEGVKKRQGHDGTAYIKLETSAINIMIILIAGLGGFLYGYVNNAISGSFAQPSFLLKFLSGTNANSLIDAMLSVFLTGGLVGAILQSWVSNRWGRRPCNFAAAVILLISSALTAGSVNVAMFIVMRGFAGIGGGMIITNCPVYMSEISPPHTRGLLVGVHAISIVFGLLVSGLLALGFNFVDTPYQWRLQFIMLTFFCLCLMVSIVFLPESPRWLIEHQNDEEAWKVLERLHRSRHDPEARLAKAEMVQIKAQVDSERSLPTGYIYMLKTPHLRRRILCSVLVWVQGQSTGLTVIVTFLAVIFNSLGFPPVLQLGLSVVFIVCAFSGCAVNMYLLDKIGRVRLMVFGGFLTSLMLIIEAVLQKFYVGTDNKAGLNAACALIFIFGFAYGSTIDCAAYVYLTEIWPTHLRSHGSGVGLVSFFLCSIAYNAPAATAFAEIGWKYYLVFAGVNIVSTILIAFTFPETAGLTLEEISAKFGDKVAVEFATDIYTDALDLKIVGKSGVGGLEVEAIEMVHDS